LIHGKSIESDPIDALASLIEITYPVFVVFFSYIMFRHLHLNPSVLMGGLMVIAGAESIICNNP